MKIFAFLIVFCFFCLSVCFSAEFYFYGTEKINLTKCTGYKAVRTDPASDVQHILRTLPGTKRPVQIHDGIFLVETGADIEPGPPVVKVLPVYQSGRVRLVPTDEIIINFDSVQDIQDLLSRFSLDTKQYLTPTTVVVSTRSAKNTVGLANEISTFRQVIYAEPNFIRIMPVLSNDPFYQYQWHLDNSGLGPAFGTPGADIHAPQAWEISRGHPDVVIAIMDMGVDMQHPDLQDNLVAGFDAYDNDDDPAPDDHEAHGTCCAGLAAAVTDNNTGIAGVAPACKIMPVRIGTTVSENDPSIISTNVKIAAGIDWAWQNGADILSHSWGGGSPSSTIASAIDRAKTQGRAGKGCVIFFAGGNDNTGVDWPATLENVVAVGATNQDDNRCSPTDWGIGGGSNYGAQLDLVAPGNLLYTTDNRGQNGYAGGDYCADFGGTSGSTPIAAGVAALVLAVAPGLTSDQVQEVMQNTADDQVGRVNEDQPGWDPDHGHGRINAYQALLSLQDECGIVLLAPNGGNSLTPFSDFAIRWTSHSAPGPVNIDLSVDAGENWTNIVTATEDDGEYVWTVPNVPSDLCFIRISVLAEPACADQSDAPFTIESYRALRLISPNGGESWPENSTQQVRWESVGINGNISISLSTDLGENWQRIGTAPASSAVYDWTLPGVAHTADACLLRLLSLEAPVETDISDGPFQITKTEPECDLKVLIPNGAELWPAGSVQTILWEPGAQARPVDIYYSPANGSGDRMIAVNAENDGCYHWTLPRDLAGQANVKIARSANPQCADTSDARFYIENPPRPAVKVDNIQGLAGDRVTARIGLMQNNTDIDALGFDLVYNTDHLRLIDTQAGHLVQNWVQFLGRETGPGRIRIGGYAVEPIAAGMSGELALLNFEVVCSACDSCSTSRLLLESPLDDIQDFTVCHGTFRHAHFCSIGDINMDRVLTPGDALCAFQMYLHQGEIDMDSPCYSACIDFAADANCDGDISPADALRIFSAYLDGDSTLTCDGIKKRPVPPSNIVAELRQNGRRLAVPVFFENGPDLTAFGIVVHYPADLYEFFAMQNGAKTAGWTHLDVYETCPGTLRIGGYNAVQSGTASAAGELFRLNFRLKTGCRPGGDIKLCQGVDDAAGSPSRVLEIGPKDADPLVRNYPNPFNASTTIEYGLSSDRHVCIDVLDVRGRLVRRLVDARQETGQHSVVWDGRDLQGHKVTTGIYFGMAKTGPLTQRFKMLIIR